MTTPQGRKGSRREQVVARTERRLLETLPESHFLRRLMDEHRRIVDAADELESLASAPNALHPARLRGALTRMRDRLERLLDTHEHHVAEETLLFSALEARGWTTHLDQMRQEHASLQAMKQTLLDAVTAALIDSSGLADRIANEARELAFEVRNHAFRENNVIFPIALNIIADDAAWTEMSERAGKPLLGD